MATATTNIPRPSGRLYGITHQRDGSPILAKHSLRRLPSGDWSFTLFNAVCAWCGGHFLAIQRDLNRQAKGANLYCDPDCGRAAHRFRMQGQRHHMWRGGRYSNDQGYILVHDPGRKSEYHYTREHIQIAERALGHALPPEAQVHHVNGIKSDNRNCNLVICQDATYHQLLHARMRVIAAGGNPNIEKVCCRCKRVKRKTAFHRDRPHWDGRTAMCKQCRSLDNKAKRIIGEKV